MFRESFLYCDDVTVAEEAGVAFVNRLVDKKMSILNFENVTVFPYSIETREFHGEVFTDNKERVNDINSETVYSGDPLIIGGLPQSVSIVEEAIYIGSQEMCWGHYFTDGISKMWCLSNPEFQRLVERGIPIYFSSDWMVVEKMPSTWKQIIDLLGGMSLQIQPLKTSTLFHKLYIPTNCIFNTKKGRYFTNEYIHLIATIRENALLKHQAWKAYEKLYFSRTHLTSDHGEFGERSLEKAFKKRGFYVVYPECLSFEQQIWLLWNAKEVAGTMGSISHNFVFCHPNAKAIIIRKAWYTNDFQYVLNQVSQIDVTYIDAHLSVFVTSDVNEGPFYMYINNNVTRYFLDTYGDKCESKFNRHLFYKYAILCLTKPDFDKRREAPRYYYTKMHEELIRNRSFARVKYHKILKMLQLIGMANLQKTVKRVVKLYNR